MLEIREYRVATRCEHKRSFFQCRRLFVGQCQYCAKGFCASHGEQFNKIEEVCFRKPCQTKKHDLALHLEFKTNANERNTREVCGLPGCLETPQTDCHRCGAHYCRGHIEERVVSTNHHGENGTDMQRVCTHCSERMPIWEKT